eukprot:COSAG06_NODE_3567_length_5177_cov_13.422804_3_plen_883_part_01
MRRGGGSSSPEAPRNNTRGGGASSPGSTDRQRGGTPRRKQARRRVEPPALTEALQRAEQEKQRAPLGSLSTEDHDWSAVLELVSDQARAIKGAVSVSNELDARLQRLETWQNEQVALGHSGAAPSGWSSKEIDAADGWQTALAGINERMGRVGTAFGSYVQTNAKRVEKLEAQLDGEVVSRLAALEQRLASEVVPPEAEAERHTTSLQPAPAAVASAVAIASEALEDRMRNEMVEALDELEKDLDARMSDLVEQERAFASQHVDKVQASVVELNQRVTSEMVSLAASVAWPVKEQNGQLHELASRADEMDARVQSNEQYATATQVLDLGVRLDKLKEWSEATNSKLSSQKKTVRAVASTVADLSGQLTAESTQRVDSASKAAKRIEAMEKTINAVRADVKSTKDAKRHKQQEALAQMRDKGSIEKSDLTTWMSEQAATVTSLEDRLAASIAEVKQDLAKVAAVEESLSAMDARQVSSSSSLEAVEARLAEVVEQAAQDRAAAQEAADTVDTRVASLMKDHAVALGSASAELARVEATGKEAADEIDARLVALAEGHAAAVQSLAAELSELEGAVEESTRISAGVQDHLREQIEEEAAQWRDDLDKANARADETAKVLKSLREDIQASQEVTLQSQQEMLGRIDADGDGKIDQAEWTQWVSEQAATVTSLEDRLAASIAEVKQDLAKVAAVEESLSAMDARQVSSSSSLEAVEARLAEVVEQAAQDRAAAQEAADKFGEELAGMENKHQATATEVKGMVGRLGDMHSTACTLAQTVDMAVTEASEIEKAVAIQAQGWERLRQTEEMLSTHLRDYADNSAQLDSRLGTSRDELTERIVAVEEAQAAAAASAAAQLDSRLGTSRDELTERIVAVEEAQAAAAASAA